MALFLYKYECAINKDADKICLHPYLIYANLRSQIYYCTIYPAFF